MSGKMERTRLEPLEHAGGRASSSFVGIRRGLFKALESQSTIEPSIGRVGRSLGRCNLNAQSQETLQEPVALGSLVHQVRTMWRRRNAHQPTVTGGLTSCLAAPPAPSSLRQRSLERLRRLFVRPPDWTERTPDTGQGEYVKQLFTQPECAELPTKQDKGAKRQERMRHVPRLGQPHLASRVFDGLLECRPQNAEQIGEGSWKSERKTPENDGSTFRTGSRLRGGGLFFMYPKTLAGNVSHEKSPSMLQSRLVGNKTLDVSATNLDKRHANACGTVPGVALGGDRPNAKASGSHQESPAENNRTGNQRRSMTPFSRSSLHASIKNPSQHLFGRFAAEITRWRSASRRRNDNMFSHRGECSRVGQHVQNTEKAIYMQQVGPDKQGCESRTETLPLTAALGKQEEQHERVVYTGHGSDPVIHDLINPCTPLSHNLVDDVKPDVTSNKMQGEKNNALSILQFGVAGCTFGDVKSTDCKVADLDSTDWNVRNAKLAESSLPTCDASSDQLERAESTGAEVTGDLVADSSCDNARNLTADDKALNFETENDAEFCGATKCPTKEEAPDKHKYTCLDETQVITVVKEVMTTTVTRTSVYQSPSIHTFKSSAFCKSQSDKSKNIPVYADQGVVSDGSISTNEREVEGQLDTDEFPTKPDPLYYCDSECCNQPEVRNTKGSGKDEQTRDVLTHQNIEGELDDTQLEITHVVDTSALQHGYLGSHHGSIAFETSSEENMAVLKTETPKPANEKCMKQSYPDSSKQSSDESLKVPSSVSWQAHDKCLSQKSEENTNIQCEDVFECKHTGYATIESTTPAVCVAYNQDILANPPIKTLPCVSGEVPSSDSSTDLIKDTCHLLEYPIQGELSAHPTAAWLSRPSFHLDPLHAVRAWAPIQRQALMLQHQLSVESRKQEQNKSSTGTVSLGVQPQTVTHAPVAVMPHEAPTETTAIPFQDSGVPQPIQVKRPVSQYTSHDGLSVLPPQAVGHPRDWGSTLTSLAQPRRIFQSLNDSKRTCDEHSVGCDIQMEGVAFIPLQECRLDPQIVSEVSEPICMHQELNKPCVESPKNSATCMASCISLPGQPEATHMANHLFVERSESLAPLPSESLDQQCSTFGCTRCIGIIPSPLQCSWCMKPDQERQGILYVQPDWMVQTGNLSSAKGTLPDHLDYLQQLERQGNSQHQEHFKPTEIQTEPPSTPEVQEPGSDVSAEGALSVPQCLRKDALLITLRPVPSNNSMAVDPPNGPSEQITTQLGASSAELQYAQERVELERFEPCMILKRRKRVTWGPLEVMHEGSFESIERPALFHDLPIKRLNEGSRELSVDGWVHMPDNSNDTQDTCRNTQTTDALIIGKARLSKCTGRSQGQSELLSNQIVTRSANSDIGTDSTPTSMDIENSQSQHEYSSSILTNDWCSTSSKIFDKHPATSADFTATTAPPLPLQRRKFPLALSKDPCVVSILQLDCQSAVLDDEGSTTTSSIGHLS